MLVYANITILACFFSIGVHFTNFSICFVYTVELNYVNLELEKVGGG